MLADLDPVVAYYEDRLQRHGAVAAGADWRDEASQQLRFRQLLRVAPARDASLLDVGCGYGALLPTLRARGFTGTYHGIDASARMIDAARALHGADCRARFTVAALRDFDEPADVVVASGTFNVKLAAASADWQLAVLAATDRMHGLARTAYAFNCLSAHADPERKQDRLFYADPAVFLDHCARRHARHCSLLQDYGLYEFTLIVRRAPLPDPEPPWPIS